MPEYIIRDNEFIEVPPSIPYPYTPGAKATPKELDVGRKHHKDDRRKRSRDGAATRRIRQGRKSGAERKRDEKKNRFYREERSKRKGERKWEGE